MWDRFLRTGLSGLSHTVIHSTLSDQLRRKIPTMSEFIVTAHCPRPEMADRFEGLDALAPVEWVVGSRRFCEAKLTVWERYYAAVMLRPVGDVVAYGAK